MKIARTREVDQSLHHTIETTNLAVDDVHMPLGVGFLVRQLVSQKLQVKDDGVDGILHLMSHAAREAPAGGKTARHLDLVANAAYGLRVSHDQKSANLRSVFLNEIEGELDAFSTGSLELALRQCAPPLEG